jgi:hypothetical protein
VAEHHPELEHDVLTGPLLLLLLEAAEVTLVVGRRQHDRVLSVAPVPLQLLDQSGGSAGGLLVEDDRIEVPLAE